MAVYLIQAGTDGPVKIGKADDPWARMSELQVGCWLRLRLLRVWKGGTAEEASLHCRFADQAIMGDWFHFSKAMLRDVGLEVDTPWEHLFEGYKRRITISNDQPPVGMVAHSSLLAEIEHYLSTRNIAETTFGRLSVNDGKFVRRLRAGENMTLATMKKVRAFIGEAA